MRQFGLITEIQARPALTEDEAVRVLGDFTQRLDVPAVLGPIDGCRELLIRFKLVRLV